MSSWLHWIAVITLDRALRQTLALAIDRDVVFAVSVTEPASRELIQAQFAKLNIPATVISFPAQYNGATGSQFYRAVPRSFRGNNAWRACDADVC